MNTLKNIVLLGAGYLAGRMSRKTGPGIGAVSKSKAVSKVLRLMDNDYSYSEAIKIVLLEDKRLNKKSLERELNNYI
jgi:uncharacterized protein YoaH (UPF0181 family)